MILRASRPTRDQDEQHSRPCQCAPGGAGTADALGVRYDSPEVAARLIDPASLRFEPPFYR